MSWRGVCWFIGVLCVSAGIVGLLAISWWYLALALFGLGVLIRTEEIDHD